MSRRLGSRNLDPYKTLQVSRRATTDEIRRAYREQVLKAHPDKNPERREWSERRIRELLEAFEIIGDSESRRRYDLESRKASAAGKGYRRRGPTPERDLFFFRKSDPECLALRILYFLLKYRGDEALDLLASSERTLGARFLFSQLERQDYLDCLFLLGEHLMKRKRYPEALDRLLELYLHEKNVRFRRHYFDLAVESIKRIYLRYLPRVLSPEALIERVEKALEDLSWSGKERARLFLVLARAHQKLDEFECMQECLEWAVQADPGHTRAREWLAEVGAR